MPPLIRATVAIALFIGLMTAGFAGLGLVLLFGFATATTDKLDAEQVIPTAKVFMIGLHTILLALILHQLSPDAARSEPDRPSPSPPPPPPLVPPGGVEPPSSD